MAVTRFGDIVLPVDRATFAEICQTEGLTPEQCVQALLAWGIRNWVRGPVV